ncbi:hypothetical protein FB565_003813 [Actinoplanes lutulentus]|uniref:Uncharacterized protein n=1 Tax=Actinoplanes lutulentus TaxID=1287878 RepID=A0A327ZJ74_9ACTN|nr:hypothetical protein [Actinoplanes lutulentus]RAK42683.1 hypothetical protein B0I29_102508 [Actinoplanes lutulentus]
MLLMLLLVLMTGLAAALFTATRGPVRPSRLK